MDERCSTGPEDRDRALTSLADPGRLRAGGAARPVIEGGLMSRAVLQVRAAVLDRLAGRFPELDSATMRRCVDDICACCEHLGVHPETELVERLVTARLTGVVKGSRPPPSRQESATCERGTEEVNL